MTFRLLRYAELTIKGRSHCVPRRTTSDAQGRTTSCVVVRRRTTSYDHVRRRTTKYVFCMRGRSNRTRAKYRRHSHYARCRAMSYVQKCAEIEHVSISAFHDVRRRTTSRVVWMPPILCTCSIRTTTYDVVRCRTQCERPLSHILWPMTHQATDPWPEFLNVLSATFNETENRKGRGYVWKIEKQISLLFVLYENERNWEICLNVHL